MSDKVKVVNSPPRCSSCSGQTGRFRCTQASEGEFFANLIGLEPMTENLQVWIILAPDEMRRRGCCYPDWFT